MCGRPFGPEVKAERRTSLLWGRDEYVSSNLPLPLHTSGYLSVLFCFTRREKDRAVLYESYLKGLHPRLPHTHITPSSLACRTCSGACNRNTMSNAGENSQAKLSMSSPASCCEILDLTSSPLMEGHGGTGGGGCRIQQDGGWSCLECICGSRYIKFPRYTSKIITWFLFPFKCCFRSLFLLPSSHYFPPSSYLSFLICHFLTVFFSTLQEDTSGPISSCTGLRSEQSNLHFTG